jgi:hypothetical protein
LSHASALFCSGYSGDRVLLSVRLTWTLILLFYASHCHWDDMHLHTPLFFFLWYWGLNSGPSPWVTSPAPPPPFSFVKVFFEIGSCELLAWAGFEPQSSWSPPLEMVGLQVWATSIQMLFSIEIRSCKLFLPGLAWNCDLPALSLLLNLGWQAHVTAPSY